MAKEIALTCEGCRKQLKTYRRNMGKKTRCPHCGSIILVAKQPDGTVRGTVERKLELEEVQARQGAMLRVLKQGDVGVVSFRTSRVLDQSNVQQLGDELDGLLKNYKLKRIVLNFENVQYMSSAVMGKLVSLYKQLQPLGGELRLCGIGQSIFEIFKIMRFDKLFTIRDTEDEAVIELMG